MKHWIALCVCLVLLLSGCGEKAASGSSGSASSGSSSRSGSSALSNSSSDADSSGKTSSQEESSASHNSSSGTTSSRKTSSTESSRAPSSSKVPTTVNVSIPEGYSFMQIAAVLEQKGVCSQKAFYQAAQAYEVQSFAIPSSSNRCFKLEGYLFPDTYQFYLDDDPVRIIRAMLNNYAAKSGMPSDETLILASIIEQEARSDTHMRMVSSVLFNRLNAGMRLECDSTREYVNRFITGNLLLSNTGKYAALYNTYKCPARPAGPVCNPGARAIAAAKNPDRSAYLYFFFGNDNTNHYSKTYEEHTAAMAEYGVQYN